MNALPSIATRRMRPHSTKLVYEGVELTCLYEEYGAYLPATDIDDACGVTVDVTEVLIGNVLVWTRWKGPRLLVDGQIEEIEQRIEQSWEAT